MPPPCRHGGTCGAAPSALFSNRHRIMCTSTGSCCSRTGPRKCTSSTGKLQHNSLRIEVSRWAALGERQTLRLPLPATALRLEAPARKRRQEPKAAPSAVAASPQRQRSAEQPFPNRRPRAAIPDSLSSFEARWPAKRLTEEAEAQPWSARYVQSVSNRLRDCCDSAWPPTLARRLSCTHPTASCRHPSSAKASVLGVEASWDVPGDGLAALRSAFNDMAFGEIRGSSGTIQSLRITKKEPGDFSSPSSNKVHQTPRGQVPSSPRLIP